jgi:hypothetical protein
MKNKELMQLLELPHRTFYEYLKLGMPKDFDLATEWIQERSGMGEKGSGKIVVGGRVYTKEDLIDLKGKNLELTAKEKQAKIDLNEFELAKKKGTLVPRDELTGTLRTVLEPLAKMLEKLPNKLSTSCNPQSPEIAYGVLEDEVQSIFQEIQKIKDRHVG